MPAGRGGLQQRDDAGGVLGVRHEEHVALAAVDDQVVDDAAGLLVAAQRVLRLAVARSGRGRW